MTTLEKEITEIKRRLKNVEARTGISEQDRPKLGSNHQGKKSLQVLIQEGQSLLNSFEPKTMSHEERKKFGFAFSSWKDQVFESNLEEHPEIARIATVISRKMEE